MCGIAGVLEREPDRQPDRDRLQRMASTLTHRGPDEAGFYLSGAVGFAHRRLSIIDLVAGQQPMESPDGQVCLVFNGEVYNYLELQADLEQKGYIFRTRSDTEVLLALYLHYGLDAFPKINGMFACAFWDRRTDQLVLARDRLGKKPLFYYHDPHRLLFGSEIKALLAYGGIDRKVHLPALHEYLSHGYTVGEQTVLEGIHRLPPAHVLVVRHGQVRCTPYWQLHFQPTATCPDETEVVERLDALLRQAVKRRLMSDVPLGAFLSGGLDSSAIVALMAEGAERPVQTFTIGFEEADYSEIQDARVIAQYLRTDHHELIVKPSALDILPDLVWYLDEPFADSSAIPTYYVCRAARQQVTVALSGDGGDEVFAGYERYRQLAADNRRQRMPTWFRRGIAGPLVGVLPFTWPGWNYLYAMAKTEGNGNGIPYRLGVYPYIQDKLYTADFTLQLRDSDPFQTTAQILRRVEHLDPVSCYQYLDTLQYLPADILTKVDRMSMANSLEVRSPLLDHTVVEYMATLPVSVKLRGGISKYIFRKLCSRLLPPATLEKKKQGFAVPKDLWFRGELYPFAQDILLDRQTLSRGYFRRETIQRLLSHHRKGQRDYSVWIWSLIVLEMWFRLFLDEQRGESVGWRAAV